MKRLNQQGAVAMISVVLFSIIISILAMAYARTIIAQQRQSINYDLSTRAYYAAEAGVQDAIRGLNADPAILEAGQNVCKSGATYMGGSIDGTLGDSQGALAYTCQLVDPTPSVLSGSTTSDSALWKIATPQNSAQGYAVTVKWSNPSSSDQTLIPREGDSKLMPPIGVWQSAGGNYHPLLRVSFISAPAGATRSDYGQEVYFLNPTSQNPTPIDVNPQAGIQQDEKKVVQNSKCEAGDNSGGFKCSQTFGVPKSLVDAGSLYMVVHSVYAKTNYEITLAEKTGKELGFKNNVVTIDVTAKAGDVFRRVRQQVPVGGGYKESWFDASGLVVGDGICKLFTVGTSPVQFSSSCNLTD